MGHTLGVYTSANVHFCLPLAPQIDDTVLLNTVWMCDCGRCFRLIGSTDGGPAGPLLWWAYDRALQNRDGGQYLADWVASHVAAGAAEPPVPDATAV